MPGAFSSTLPARRAYAVLCLCLALTLQACAPARGLEAWRLLNDLSNSIQPTVLGDDVSRKAITYGPAGAPYGGDLYRAPDGGTPFVLIPGASESGKDDPRLIATAHSFARKGFAVLVPDIANLRRLHVAASDARQIAAAIDHMAVQNADAAPSVMVLAVSYALGPAVIAALEPPAQDQVKAILAVGGYYDLTAVITFFTTGHYRERSDSPWRQRTPNAYGKWVFLLSNAARLDDWRDRALLRALAERKLFDPAADISDLVSRLGAEGRAVQQLLDNRDPEAVAALIEGLPSGIKAEIAALDLKRRDLAGLKAEIILLHGRNDPIIPESESQALARALPEDQADLYLLDGLEHVELQPAHLGDRLQLWRAAYRLLELRDSLGSGG